MHPDSLAFLRSTSDFMQFSKDEYICHEGQPGHSMYIVLQGTVGIYLTSITGQLTEVSRMGNGAFFGEMAIFDQMPRSATCIALEDTICVAINRENLPQFLKNCPDIVEQMLVNMSLRIRNMDRMLTQTRAITSKQKPVTPFALPEEFRGKYAYEPRQNPKLFLSYQDACPLCSGTITVTQMRHNLLSPERVDPDRRIRYTAADPLLYEIITCPHCLYSNHYLQFFNVNPDTRPQIRKVVFDQRPATSWVRQYGTMFDRTIVSYLQAIHLNEHTNASDYTLPGMLWLRLYWLAEHTGDQTFITYCAINATRFLTGAIDQAQISDPICRCSIALSTAHLLRYLGSPDKAMKYCTIASNCPDEEIKKQAQKLEELLAAMPEKRL